MKRLSLRDKRVLALALLFNACPLPPASAAPSPFALVSHEPKTLPASTVIALTKQTSAADATGDTLTFRRKTIRLVVTTGPEDDMLSYRIADRRNPTLIVPSGALLQVLFVNSDDDMSHDLRFGAMAKAFADRPSAVGTTGSMTLPHRTGKNVAAEELTLRVPATSGRFIYYCTVRGHAKGGMVGTLIVR